MSNFPMSARNHSYFQDLLEQHISGEPLSPDDRLSLFDHIETCDDCRQILEAETRITARMKSVPRLVAPADLRSKILSQAVRDHRERTTTPSEDPTISDLLKARPAADEQNAPRPASAPASAQSANSSAPAAKQPSGRPSRRPPADDFPVFAGIARPAPSRIRRAWQRASPVLATAFLTLAGLAALYSGQFQGIPVAGEAQGLLLAAVDAMTKPAPAPTAEKPEPVYMSNSRFQGRAPASSKGSVASSGSDSRPAVTLIEAPSDNSIHNVQIAAGAPLPGTGAVVDLMHRMRSWGAAADSTVAALSAAASEPVPAPAEKSAPQIAALVLRPTDRDDGTGGFRDSELAEALESIARTQPGGRIARQDQFAMDGHRYRLYTLELPAGFTNQMVETLTPYRSPADGVIVNALISQDSVNTSRGGAVQFYSSNEARLRSALQTIRPVVSHGANERVRVVVVE